MMKLTLREIMKQWHTHSRGSVNMALHTTKFIIHSSLLLQYVVVHWPSTDYFAFTVSTAAFRYTVQLVNLHVQHRLLDE
jgi:hypothetical protein